VLFRSTNEQKYNVKGNRYVYKKADPYSSHSQILRWVEQERPAEVLEVGTAAGYLTSEMASLGCKVTGIEQDVDMAALARRYCDQMVVGDIESLDLGGLGRYDAIILGDILEHLRDPRAVLERLVTLLKPGGKVLISLPNVANIWVRLNLLFGRFNYSNVGILDESHLRFYTLKTARRLADESGLDVVSMSVTPIPLPLILPSTSKGRSLSLLHKLNWGLTKLRKTLFGNQFILVCRPKA
jgi:2-polyprenyl-3-methyl-5-hydroxy-6-metoxy-1,4-benzoquinol methylase